MAGDRIYFDHDFPDKPEVTLLSQDTGVTIGEIMVRFHKFWRHFDRHIGDKFAPGLGPVGLAIIAGGDANFWLAAEIVGWVIFRDGGCEMPGFHERLDTGRGCAYKRMRSKDELREKDRERQRRMRLRKRHADNSVTGCVTGGVTGGVTSTVTGCVTTSGFSRPSNLIPLTSNLVPTTKEDLPPPPPPPGGVGELGGGGDGGEEFTERIKQGANAVCRALRLHPPTEGKYRRLIVQAVILADGCMGDTWLEDAIEDTAKAKPTKPWPYFRACLASGCAAHGRNLDELLAKTSVPARFLKAEASHAS